MNNQTKSQRKVLVPQKKRIDDNNAVAIVKSVAQLACVAQDSDALVSQEILWETRCTKSWNQFKGYDSLSPRYVKRVSGKRKDHRWEK